MVRVEELRFDDHTIRLALLENRWWIFCDDAAPQIDLHLSPAKLFADTPEGERRIASTGADSFAYLVSARHLLYWLHKGETTNHNRLRAWLRAWKVISDATAFRDDDAGARQ